MARTPKTLVFAFFLVSGFCSLLYQVVWLRLAYASFGVITPVLSVLLSVFMAGLYVGTWAAGRWAQPLSLRSGRPAILLYAVAELLIGLGALAVPALFGLGERLLLGAGATDSGTYLWRSALVMAAAVFPWCVAMGATVPLMLAQLRQEGQGGDKDFSFLYLANVAGALLGVLVTAVALIEVLGLRGTGRLGALLNLGLAAGAGGLAMTARGVPKRPRTAPAPSGRKGDLSPGLAHGTLFLTGFLAMAMEVTWIRALTPVLKTQVYSFALVLFTYLGSTFLGSYLYRRGAGKPGSATPAQLLAWCGLAALLPLVLNDPRLGAGVAGALVSLVPFCLGLGLLTPMLIDRVSGGDPRLAGQAYAWNILGCVLGPLAASYLLLPHLGVKAALLLLSLPFLPLLLAVLKPAARPLAAGLGAVALGLPLALSWTYEDPGAHPEGLVDLKRDHTATSVALGEGRGARLLVNGIGITHTTPITKVMAHLPAAFCERPPQNGLVICFGMGTTFRSLSSWGMRTTAVELVPGVKELFGRFFDDAGQVLARPGNAVVIDDGRRYLMRTRERFDVVTIDPPPPLEAAASSLLYSEEFYALVKRRMGEGAVLQQWAPGGQPEALRAVLRTLTAQFPHVRAFQSFEGWGFHFLASMRPLPERGPAQLEARMPAAAKADLMEWFKRGQPSGVFAATLAREIDIEAFLGGWERRITDDRPYNEYYLLRTLFPGLVGRFL